MADTNGTQATRQRVSKIGVVTSNKMDKSVVVRVDRTLLDRMYKRYVRRSIKFMAHDEQNACDIGDTVEIIETRPLSARKRWRVRRIVRKAVEVATNVGTEAPADGTGERA